MEPRRVGRGDLRLRSRPGLVPINVNYRYVADELRYVFENADVEAVVVERSFLPLVAEIVAELPQLRHVIVLDDGGERRPTASTRRRYEDALAAARAERGSAPRARPTTSTSSTPAAPPACPRA